MSDFATIPMELRTASVEGRTIEGVVAPYDEISYFTPYNSGERILRSAFVKSIAQRGNRVKLLRNHDAANPMGRAIGWQDGHDGLVGSFMVKTGTAGDELLDEVRQGMLDGLSVGFRELRGQRGADGVHEVHEAQLAEVSLVGIAAYDGASVLAVRHAVSREDILAPFGPTPEIDLSPLPRFW